MRTSRHPTRLHETRAPFSKWIDDRTVTRRLSHLAGLAIAALTLAACGPRHITTSTLDQQIHDGITNQTGLTVASVSCPKSIPVQAGYKFSCTAAIRELEEPLTVDVSVQDANGNLTWQLHDELIPTDSVVNSIKDGLKEQRGIEAVTVTCPPKAIKRPGYGFQCAAQFPDGSTFIVGVSIDNLQGDMSWKVNPPVSPH